MRVAELLRMMQLSCRGDASCTFTVLRLRALVAATPALAATKASTAQYAPSAKSMVICCQVL